jgi:hypothetical protein
MPAAFVLLEEAPHFQETAAIVPAEHITALGWVTIGSLLGAKHPSSTYSAPLVDGGPVRRSEFGSVGGNYAQSQSMRD